MKKDLVDNGLVQRNDLVKVLGRGELTCALTSLL